MRTKNYRDIKKRLNKFTDFSFKMPRKGKDFTPQQKAALTRAWSKHAKDVRKVEAGQAIFKPTTKYTRDTLGKNYHHTNKGIFVPRANEVNIKKKNGKRILEIKRNRGKDIYIKWNVEEFPIFDDFIKMVWKEYKPDAVAKSIGGRAIGATDGLEVTGSDEQHIISGKITTNDFDGAFALYFKTKQPKRKNRSKKK